MFKFLLALLLLCILISFVIEYWVWILLTLVLLIGVYVFCLKKGYIKRPEPNQSTGKNTAKNKGKLNLLNPTSSANSDYYLAYHYNDVKFYPPTKMVSKIKKKLLTPGAEVILKQEPKNKCDKRAVALYISGHQIGYMLRGTLQDMANDYIEQGWPIKAILSSLTLVNGEYQGYIHLFYYLKSTKPKRLGYQDIDVHSIKPSNPDAVPDTPLRGKNIVFSGVFTLPLDEMMQIAVDAGATLKVLISKSTDYLVVGEQDTIFLDKDGLSSKEATATKLIQQDESNISIINEATFLALAKEIAAP